MTIGDRLSSRNNALNFVRLVMATIVIVAHTWPLGGYGVEPDVGDSNIGHLAVAGFFAISGYLITISRLRLPFLRFMVNRVMRIFPAFLACLVVVAFVIAPVMDAAAQSGWSFNSALDYVLRNAGLFIFQYGIADGPVGVPFPGYWNGSLWTLFYEFIAYLLTAILFSLPAARLRPAVFAGIVFALTIVGQVAAPALLSSVSTNMYRNLVTNALWLGAFYAAGALVAALRDRIPVTAPLAIVSVVLLSISVLTHTVTMLGALPLAYLVLWCGAILPLRLGSRNDISYGVYIYAFPVQQALAAFDLQNFVPFTVFALVALAITVPLAWASWTFIEKPAMRLGRLVPQGTTLRLPRRRSDPSAEASELPQ